MKQIDFGKIGSECMDYVWDRLQDGGPSAMSQYAFSDIIQRGIRDQIVKKQPFLWKLIDDNHDVVVIDKDGFIYSCETFPEIEDDRWVSEYQIKPIGSYLGDTTLWQLMVWSREEEC